MATQEDSAPSAGIREPSDRLKKRLETCFEHGTKQASQDKYDYATNLFGECVVGDPGNLPYLQSFMANLQKKFGSPKKLSPLVGFSTRGGKAALKKAVAQRDRATAFKAGVEVLTLNPWDVSTLVTLADICAEVLKEQGMSVAVTYGDCELFYRKLAFDTFPRDKPDADVCRQMAEALAKRDRYPEAISFWHRVELARPNDDEPKRQIATLTVMQHKGKESAYDDDKKTAARPGAGKPEELTHEDRLKQRIKRNPTDLSGYDELGNLYLNTDRYVEAEEIFNQKLKASNDDPTVREEIEDVQLRALRSKMIAADKKAKESGNDADKKEHARIRMTVIDKELLVYQNRCERYPNNLVFRFELAERHRWKGDIAEAIKEYQIAKSDPRKRGMSLIYLGECFRSIKQYPLAMSHFEQAVVEIPDREAEYKKLAYYRAGKLAMGLKDLVRADKYLTTLASMDYTFRDVSDLLGRLQQMKEQEAKGTGAEPQRREKPKQADGDEETTDE